MVLDAVRRFLNVVDISGDGCCTEEGICTNLCNWIWVIDWAMLRLGALWVNNVNSLHCGTDKMLRLEVMHQKAVWQLPTDNKRRRSHIFYQTKEENSAVKSLKSKEK